MNYFSRVPFLHTLNAQRSIKKSIIVTFTIPKILVHHHDRRAKTPSHTLQNPFVLFLIPKQNKSLFFVEQLLTTLPPPVSSTYHAFINFRPLQNRPCGGDYSRSPRVDDVREEEWYDERRPPPRTSSSSQPWWLSSYVLLDDHQLDILVIVVREHSR